MSIQHVEATQILDSRGNPTVQVRVHTEHGVFVAQVPSGASKGSYEALELRDEDPAKFGGKGVLKAVDSVNGILGPALVQSGLKADQQSEIDEYLLQLDGTKNKSKLGANAILGISMAVARAGAAAKNIQLFEHIGDLSGIPRDRPYVMPVPFTNQINGGVHSGNTLAMQEFMVCPVGAKSMQHAVQIASEVYHALKSVIADKFGTSGTGIGDEGGFAPPLQHAQQAFALLQEAVAATNHQGLVKFALDPASSEFFHDGHYDLAFKDASSKQKPLTGEELGDVYRKLADEFPLALLEDPFAEDDWPSWQAFLKKHEQSGNKFEIVGDDLLATNIERIKLASEKHACNSLLLKINQIGTITESIKAALRAYQLGWSVFVSHRSGETIDDFIADLTVGLRTGHLKSGAPCRGERVAKYNRLMDIERILGSKAVYAGHDFRYAHKSAIA